MGEGVYAASQTGAEVKLGPSGLGPSASGYVRETTRNGQPQGERQVGVELEKAVGPASVSLDVSNQGVALGAKVETPAVRGQRVGLEATFTVATEGNARARERALAVMHQQTTNLVARNWGLH